MAPVCSPVYSAASHSLARKQMLASAGPTDNAENIHSSFVDPSFDLDHTIFTTLRSLLKRALTTARLNVRHEWKDQAAREVETIYASLIKPPPADDTALFKFMAEECDFGMEHADGSFMDHLHFCHEYSLLHFAQVTSAIMTPPACPLHSAAPNLARPTNGQISRVSGLSTYSPSALNSRCWHQLLSYEDRKAPHARLAALRDGNAAYRSVPRSAAPSCARPPDR